MDFATTATQDELAQAARRYLTDRYPPSRVAEFAGRGTQDIGAWPELRRQGWLDPELGIVELAMLSQENGRALHPVPWWSTVSMALPAYQAAGLELPGPASYGDGRTTCRARHDGTAWRLDGQVPRVVDAAGAVEVVVAAATGTGTSLLAIRTTDPGVELVPDGGLDALRQSATVRMVHAPGRLLLAGEAAEATRATVERRAAALLCAEAVGVGQQALAMAVEHARVRVQFERPIGSFQAVAHRLADSYADLELARSLAYRAAAALDAATTVDGGGRDGAWQRVDDALACAEVACPDAAVAACESAVQVCGGMGVTWEFPLHWWYRRALWIRSLHAGRGDPLATIAGTLLRSATWRPRP